MTFPGLVQKTWVFFLTACILLSFAVFKVDGDAQKISPGLSAELDRDTATVMDIVTLTLRYRLPDGSHLQKPIEIKGLEQLTVIDQQLQPNQITLKLLVGLSDSWKTGPISVAYRNTKGAKKILSSNPVSLNVLPTLGKRPEERTTDDSIEEETLKPIQGIIPIEKTHWLQYVFWTIAIVVLLFLAPYFERWILKSPIGKEGVRPQDPPHIQIQKDLEGLIDQRLYEHGEVKQFYFIFSEIMRRYLECLRGFPAKELTTQEISSRIHYNIDHTLLALLHHADSVKFADTIPTQAQKDKDVQAVFAYIQKTAPKSPSPMPCDSKRGI